MPRNLKSLRIAGQIFYVYLINNHVDFPVALCPEKIFNFLPTGTVCSVNCLNWCSISFFISVIYVEELLFLFLALIFYISMSMLEIKNIMRRKEKRSCVHEKYICEPFLCGEWKNETDRMSLVLLPVCSMSVRVCNLSTSWRCSGRWKGCALLMYS